MYFRVFPLLLTLRASAQTHCLFRTRSRERERRGWIERSHRKQRPTSQPLSAFASCSHTNKGSCNLLLRLVQFFKFLLEHETSMRGAVHVNFTLGTTHRPRDGLFPNEGPTRAQTTEDLPLTRNTPKKNIWQRACTRPAQLPGTGPINRLGERGMGRTAMQAAGGSRVLRTKCTAWAC